MAGLDERRSRRRSRAMQALHERAILHDSPSRRARRITRSIRIAAKPLLQLTPISERVIDRIQELERRRRGKLDPAASAESVELGGVAAEEQFPTRGPLSDLTILYFHGGGFFAGSIASHRPMTSRLAVLAEATVFSVEYRQLPLATIADSVQDAIAAYEAVLQKATDPERIVVAGDSAGGYLAVKVAELATRRGLTRPAGVIGFSPLLSVDPERTDKDVRRVSRVRDALLPSRRIGRIRRLWLPDEAVIEGFASPLYATSYITCPVYLDAVEDEFLRPEVEALALLLTSKGIEVELHIWRGLVHAFEVFVGLIPEADEAVAAAASFARRCSGQPFDETSDGGPDETSGGQSSSVNDNASV